MLRITLHPDGSATFHLAPGPRLAQIARAVRMLDLVCHEFGLTYGELLGRAKPRRLVEPRQIAMVLAVRRYRLDKDTAASLFQRHPRDLDFAIRAVANRIATEPPYAARYRALEAQLDQIEDSDVLRALAG